MIGYVKWFNAEKGYGFVTSIRGKDAFFYYTDIICEGFRTMKNHTFVYYDLEVAEDGKRCKAHNVRKAEPNELMAIRQIQPRK